MVVSRKFKTILYDEPLPKTPKFEPSHWRSTNEYLDEEVHNDEIHGVTDDTNYGNNNA
jgi:hypothetical protein